MTIPTESSPSPSPTPSYTVADDSDSRARALEDQLAKFSVYQQRIDEFLNTVQQARAALESNVEGRNLELALNEKEKKIQSLKESLANLEIKLQKSCPEAARKDTGSNKGIGFEIVRGLSKQGITTVLTARDQTRGFLAQSELAAYGLKVVFHQLDVSSTDSIEDFASWLEKEYGGLDILINNAAICTQEVSYENAKSLLETNYFGVIRLTEKLLPLLRPSPFGARIVNISSRLGQIRRCNNEAVIKHIRDNFEQLDVAVLDSIVQQFLEDVKSGDWSSKGWDKQYVQYATSKLFLNAYSRLLAKSLSNRTDGHRVFVNVICPGFVSTDLTNNNPAAKSAEQGADTPIWLALAEDGGGTGKFYAERKAIGYTADKR